MTILDQIIDHKKAEVEQTQNKIPLKELQSQVRQHPLVDFKSALLQNGIQVIAEIKRKSPSAGELYSKTDVVSVAHSYEQHGACAISVLTDNRYFGGTLDFLKQIKSNVSIPVLRKDFIISPYQVYESFYAGADAILLIADLLSNELLDELFHLAIELDLTPLVEVHSQETLLNLDKLPITVIGVNARNLKSMKTDLGQCAQMVKSLPEHSIKAAESGIETPDDLHFVSQLGYDAALVGTSLMKSENPGEALKSLLNGVHS